MKGKQMSNLATITVKQSDEYQNLATLASVTFTAGTTYVIQVSGEVIVCEKATKPTTGGFYVTNDEPFEFVAASDPLWIKNLQKNVPAIVNIAD